MIASRNAASLRCRLMIGVVLAFVSLAVYLPSIKFDFINYDDPVYFAENPHVLGGLTRQNIRWALQAQENSDRLPVTWLSLMLDATLFGKSPAGPHFTNAALHALNSALLFTLLLQLTGFIWRSAFVAALFALHPLRVESVAWITERKDVLSALFGFLCLLAYTRHAQTRNPVRIGFRCSRPYALAVLFFAFALMSKSMLITLPCLMLLLDFWPLQRMRLNTLRPLCLEKLPFFALSVLSGVTTFLAHQHSGAVVSLMTLSWGQRLQNSVVSCLRYVGKFFWPTHLALPYPHPGQWPLVLVMIAAVVVLGTSVVALSYRKKFPHLFVGWFWFVGMLTPVLGILQWGVQSMADRFTYLPLIGFSIGITWMVAEWLERSKKSPWLRIAIPVGILSACIVTTESQLAHWRDSERLFRHALSVTSGNYVAHVNLGNALVQRGYIDGAREQFASALKIKPDFSNALSSLAKLHHQDGQYTEAIKLLRQVVKQNPANAESLQNLASALAAQGELNEAIELYKEALRLKPDYDHARENLAIALNQSQMWEAASFHYSKGEGLLKERAAEEAITEFHEALRLRPAWPEALNNLAWLRATYSDAAVRDGREAVILASQACQLTDRTNLWLLSTLAAAYAEAGDYTRATETQRTVCKLAERHAAESATREQFTKRLDLYRSGQSYHEP